MHSEATTFNWPSKLVVNLITLSRDIMSIVLSEIYLIYTTMLKDYSFKILRIAVDYVARASVLRALERPRASDISWDPRLLFAVTCSSPKSVIW